MRITTIGNRPGVIAGLADPGVEVGIEARRAGRSADSRAHCVEQRYSDRVPTTTSNTSASVSTMMAHAAEYRQFVLESVAVNFLSGRHLIMGPLVSNPVETAGVV